MPAELVIEVSTDGAGYREVARWVNEIDAEDHEVQMRDWVARFEATDARWVRVRGISPGPIPEWHPGHGEYRIIFVDDVVLELD